ncbi:transforming acidic coiled-coil-containing protein 1-like [Gordionus sp. m RMFG-2023]|uniref:transforming acidic coiled-coil-containing protein 1-like n=1 Tax=Gordionus sp. m RMFG-2023 TaxID=3053472 RepID=UPI0031FCA56B
MIVEQSEANKSQISSPQPPTLIPKEDYLAISKERDQLLEDVKGVEVAFSDLHRRYEKLKVNLENYKSNEEILLRSINDNERELQESTKVQIEFKHQTDAILKQANVSQVKYNKLEMKTTRLERELIQKNEENAQLHVMCDELIAKMEQN